MLRPRLCEKARPFFCACMAGRHGGDVSHHSLYSLSLCSRMAMAAVKAMPAMETVPDTGAVPIVALGRYIRQAPPESCLAAAPAVLCRRASGLYSSAMDITTRLSSLLLKGCTVSPLKPVLMREELMPYLRMSCLATAMVRCSERRRLMSALPVLTSA